MLPAVRTFSFSSDLCVHDGVTMPCNLQSWSFGFRFDLSFHDVMLPSSPQTLTYGYRFDLSLRGVMLTLLWTLTFGDCMDLWLRVQPERAWRHGAVLPAVRTFSFSSDLSVHDGVTMPCNLQSWSFGFRFDLSFHDVMHPSSPQTLTYGYRFDLSSRGVTQTLLWTLTLVDCSDLSCNLPLC